MPHFAKIVDGKVEQIIVATHEFIKEFADDAQWIETDQCANLGFGLRRNYAGIGFTYDPIDDAFIPPKPFESWVLSKDKYIWEAPILYPDDGKDYKWDESSKSWVEPSK